MTLLNQVKLKPGFWTFVTTIEMPGTWITARYKRDPEQAYADVVGYLVFQGQQVAVKYW